jgi:hypothetical protein
LLALIAGSSGAKICRRIPERPGYPGRTTGRGR